jgi:hypothetical protein
MSQTTLQFFDQQDGTVEVIPKSAYQNAAEDSGDEGAVDCTTDTRIQPWKEFADHKSDKHVEALKAAPALSVIGLKKASLLNYAAENR